MNARFSIRFGARRTMRISLIIYTIMALRLLLITVALVDPPSMIYFFIPLVLLVALNLAIEPNSSSVAMEPIGTNAGIASFLYRTAFFFSGAFLGSIINHFMERGVYAMVISFFLVGLLCLFLAYGDKRILKIKRTHNVTCKKKRSRRIPFFT
jgi:DHA1 family bicyclomycin/chloramphenicol resistance-like MFS transporter